MFYPFPLVRAIACRRALLVASLSVLMSGCSQNPISFLDPQGPIAEAQKQHFWFIVIVTLVVVAPVILQTPFLLWRYRYSGNAVYRPHWGNSRWLDIAIWGVPLIIVIILAVVLWRQTHELDPYRPIDSDKPPLQVQVVGFDWKWLFIYPEQGIATIGQLVLPEDRPVAFHLTSASVLQTFFIPALGSQIDVMNRMVTQLHLQADNTGKFQGKNMQYNGSGFHRQRFMTHVVDETQFDEFAARARHDGQPLDRQRFDKLNDKSDAVDFAHALGMADYQHGDLMTFSPIPSHLFHAIADHTSIDWSLPKALPPENRKPLAGKSSPSSREPLHHGVNGGTDDDGTDSEGTHDGAKDNAREKTCE